MAGIATPSMERVSRDPVPRALASARGAPAGVVAELILDLVYRQSH